MAVTEENKETLKEILKDDNVGDVTMVMVTSLSGTQVSTSVWFSGEEKAPTIYSALQFLIALLQENGISKAKFFELASLIFEDTQDGLNDDINPMSFVTRKPKEGGGSDE